MAKRGRPTNKVLRKRKDAKDKGRLSVLVAILIIIVLCYLAYFTLIKGNFNI